MPIQSKNPATLEVLKTFDEITPQQLEQKLAKAQAAFDIWNQTPITKRAELMLRLAEYLVTNKNQMGLLAALEMGKTLQAAAVELEKCALNCEYYAENAEKFLADEHIKTSAAESYISFEPLGVLLAIMPWNFPFWQVYRFAAPALMAGNVVVLKHSSNVPQCAEAIEKSFKDCGFPEGVFQNLLLPATRTGEAIRDWRVKAIALTGSEKAGAEVAKIASENIKKSVLELGGSDPFIVFADADINLACDLAADSRLSNNAGQVCNAAKRFIVHSSVAASFTSGLVQRFKKLRIGDPLDAATNIGPLSGENILNALKTQVEQSVKLGAQIECGGKQPDLSAQPALEKGYFYEPTVLSGVKKGMAVYDQEVFGPVAPVITFETEQQAVAIANDTEYGLGAAIITKDIAKAKKLAKQIQAGNVFINERVRSDPRLPFGGIKKSGYGRELSHYGIKEFTNIKTILVK